MTFFVILNKLGEGGGGGGGWCQSNLRSRKFDLQLRMHKSFLYKRYDNFKDFLKFSENSNYKIIC